MDVKKSGNCPFTFFGTVTLFKNLIFFRNFYKVFEGFTLQFFNILQQAGVSKSPKGPSFTVLKTLRIFRIRYSADFARSRLFVITFP